MKDNIITISYQNWDNRVKAIQTKIKNKYKKYSNLGFYSHKLAECIIETQQDGKTIVIDNNKYKEIRKYLISDDFNITE